jgi:hypothetical protein
MFCDLPASWRLVHFLTLGVFMAALEKLKVVQDEDKEAFAAGTCGRRREHFGRRISPLTRKGEIGRNCD